jgi:hypothetical protein
VLNKYYYYFTCVSLASAGACGSCEFSFLIADRMARGRDLHDDSMTAPTPYVVRVLRRTSVAPCGPGAQPNTPPTKPPGFTHGRYRSTYVLRVLESSTVYIYRACRGISKHHRKRRRCRMTDDTTYLTMYCNAHLCKGRSFLIDRHEANSDVVHSL